MKSLLLECSDRSVIGMLRWEFKLLCCLPLLRSFCFEKQKQRLESWAIIVSRFIRREEIVFLHLGLLQTPLRPACLASPFEQIFSFWCSISFPPIIILYLQKEEIISALTNDKAARVKRAAPRKEDLNWKNNSGNDLFSSKLFWVVRKIIVFQHFLFVYLFAP